ncbi:MAG: Hsp70 family protein [Candidatus Sericytochromatia bacterium]|nr:Hsp70 family protein [Candidatus Sericytochromatia bacterium]
MNRPLALDFGTSNTVVAAWNEATGEAETLFLPGLSMPGSDGAPPLIPSLVYVEDAAVGRCLIGGEVMAAGRDQAGAPRCFAGFKRGLAASVAGFAPRLDGQEVTAGLVGSWFLKRVVEALPEGGELVVTVPVTAFERYLDWLGLIASPPASRRIRVLDESTAAALGYEVPADEAPVLVIDFGGGTLDVSLVRLPPLGAAGTVLQGDGSPPEAAGVATVLGKAGQILGGADLDTWLVDDFLARHGASSQEVAEDLSLLRALAERTKIRLSSHPTADLAYFHAASGRTWRHAYTREEFEDVLEHHDLFARIQGTIDQVLRQAEARGVTRAGIGRVLLVGGSTTIPAVHRTLRQGFPRERVVSHKPFEAVAHGALALARGASLHDHLYHGYGIRHWDERRQRHLYEPIFSPGQPYPSAEPVELVLRASRPGQGMIELIVGEMEPQGPGAAEVVYHEGRLVASPVEPEAPRVVPLNDTPETRTIARLEPPGQPGVDRIKASFEVDAERRLRLTVTDLLTGATLIPHAIVTRLR